MKLTKYGHACVVLEEHARRLIVDPGEFTKDFGDTDKIVAVVVTHVHGDHLFADHLQTIVSANPDVKIFTTMEGAKAWADPHAQAAKVGEDINVGPFTLRFYGELHNAVHPEWPQNQNIGIMVNDSFYYPGDSFTVPDRKVKVLALPVSAPWLQLGQAINFVKEISPEQYFRTHDGLYNKEGLATTDKWLTMASEKFGPKYHALEPGTSIEF